jgi:type IV secretion system protein VirB9
MLRPISLALVLLAASPALLAAQNTRDLTAGRLTIVPIAAKLRFTTMIVLPDSEEILDFVCGDKDNWVISGAHNIAYVKPAKAGAATNLNLVTASGGVYSFLLTEGGAEPDLKVYVRPDPASSAPTAGARRFHTAAEFDELQRTLADLRTQLREAREAAARSVEDSANAKLAAAREIEASAAAFRASYPTTLRFPYRYKANEKPFNVSAIFHDGRFTYIRSEAAELPALYELRDDSPNLIHFQVEDGVYIVPRVLERGYLAIGKRKLEFRVER